MPAPNIARRLNLIADPAAILREAGFVPDAWQEDLLRSRDRRVAILNARQTGKTLTVAGMVVRDSLLIPGSLSLIVSPGQRQSNESFEKIGFLIDELGLGPALMKDGLAKRECRWLNGSRVISLPGKASTVRGYSGVRNVIIDEAALASDELFNTLRPMLIISGGRMVLLSTPFGARGFFHETCTKKSAGWKVVKVTALECARLRDKKAEDGRPYLDVEREILSDYWFEQEYLCKFQAAVGSLFAPEHIQRAIDFGVRPLDESDPTWNIQAHSVITNDVHEIEVN